MPRKSKDYEPCPACGGRLRWRGLRHPVCGICEITILDSAWLYLRGRLERDNASVDVLAALDKAMLADCKEVLHSAANRKPYRRRHLPSPNSHLP